MQADTMKVGRAYAYREKRARGVPLAKVRLIDDMPGRRGKIKVRFEDGPHPGLEEYVSTRQIVCRWGDRKAVLRDEERREALDRHTAKVFDATLADAAGIVLEATGEPGGGMFGGRVYMAEAELQRIADRAGLDGAPVRLHRLGFIDRQGWANLPLEAGVALAQAFAAAEPETVLMYIEAQEQQLKAEGFAPGERHLHDYLRKWQPAFALARQWAGVAREAEMLQKEIGRLRGLVSQAAYELRAAGEERKSQRLLRALDGR